MINYTIEIVETINNFQSNDLLNHYYSSNMIFFK